MDQPHARRPSRQILFAGLLLSLLFYLRCAPWDLYGHVMIGAPFGRDFVNFWIGGHLALTGQLAMLKELPAYNELIAATFHHAADAFMFSYPPHILLVLAPLACLPYMAALSIWTGLNLAALAATARRLAGATAWTDVALWTCLSPAALMMVLYGHFGGLMALAAAIVILDGERRPILGGLCLAALTVKPQIALALGIILLGAGRWRCLPAAATATLALVSLSAALFGLDAWSNFILFTLREQSRLLSEGDIAVLGTTISVFRGLQVLGVPYVLAQTVQIGVSIAAITVAILTLRRDQAPTTLTFIVPLAAVVALPYANHYDLAILAPALTLLVMQAGRASGRALVLAAAWLLPALAYTFTHLGLPVVPVVLVAALFVDATPRAAAPAPLAA